MKIIVAHPGKQHSYHTAVAIKHAGHLLRYITTFYSYKKKRSISVLNGKFSQRRCGELDDSEVITFGKYLFILNSILLRLNKKAYRWFNDLTAEYFGKRVANFAIKNKADAVIMYDTSCDRCFRILKKKAPWIIRIQDVAAINRIYMANVYDEEMNRSPENKSSIMKERGFVFEKKNQHKWKSEIDNTDFYLVPSKIVRQSLVYSEADPNRILICPYGANFDRQKKKDNFCTGEKLNILYVGSVTQMKGISYLLDVFSELSEEQYTLTVVGDIQMSTAREKKVSPRVNFIGYVPHEKLAQYYEKCDVFVFPSLGDSFGLVVLEAMSFGLPVICSDHAGASDVITDVENGYVVPVGDKEAIENRLNHLYKHIDLLKVMSEKAQETAEKYSWGNYEKAIANAINVILNCEAK